jgi:hypothetical protein
MFAVRKILWKLLAEGKERKNKNGEGEWDY